MPVAAVPKYLGSNFQTASPGMRFGMYLPIWRDDWSKEKSVASFLKDKICPLTQSDIKTLEALIKRQKAVAQICNTDTLFVTAAQSVAPFTTGLGNEHPLENGFSFLNPYGLPYLPGSGVKGVLRQAARELMDGQWANPQGWNKEIIEMLFGSDPEQELKRGVLSFWDVIPQIKGNHLAVDIMTPHQSHYYQNGENPHESGQPNPISFLTVPPKSDFTFYVQCDTTRLRKLAPDLMAEEDGKQRWRVLFERAFEHAFEWLGFGAKTAVGYGAMKLDAQETEKIRFEQATTRVVASMSEAEREIEAFIEHFRKRTVALQGKREKANGADHQKASELAKKAHENDGWTADNKKAAADAIEEYLPKVVSVEMKDVRKKLKLAELKNPAV
jgi:CRISPR-associated protein Cmr6